MNSAKFYEAMQKLQSQGQGKQRLRNIALCAAAAGIAGIMCSEQDSTKKDKSVYEAFAPLEKKITEQAGTCTAEETVHQKPVPEKWQGIYEIKRIYDLENLSDPKTDSFENDDDTTLLARLIFGETRGESKDFKREIAYTVLNRTNKNKWWGNTLREVITCAGQYAFLNDINKKKALNPWAWEQKQVWQECIEIAQETLLSPDKATNNATHFCSAENPPFWAENKTPAKVLTKKDGSRINCYCLER